MTPSLPQPNQKGKILIAEDSPTQAEQLKHLLLAHGYVVVTAGNGKEALQAVHEEKPTLIISDIMMPGTQVREMVKQIKSVPIAFISVVRMSDIEKEELGKQKNVKDYIQKPFDLDDLIRRVKRLVENE